jgi:hypothetical protein
LAAEVINLIFPPTCKIAMPVIILIFSHMFFGNNENYHHITYKRPSIIMELDTFLAVKCLNHLTWRDRWVGSGMHTLVKFFQSYIVGYDWLTYITILCFVWLNIGWATTSLSCSQSSKYTLSIFFTFQWTFLVQAPF